MKRITFLMHNAVVLFSLVVLSCLVSTMALFMGGGQAGVDLHTLLNLQIGSIPVALIAVLLSRYAGGVGSGATARKLYTATPQWMVFCFLIIALLGAFGEVALIVVARTIVDDVSWTAHVPLISMVTCSLAICSVYARGQLIAGRPVAFSGRWSP